MPPIKTNIQEGPRYPLALDGKGQMYSGESFATFVDDVSEVRQFLFNDVYRAILAIQSEIGIGSPHVFLPEFLTLRAWTLSYNVEHDSLGGHDLTRIVAKTNTPTIAALTVTQNGVGAGIRVKVTSGDMLRLMRNYE